MSGATVSVNPKLGDGTIVQIGGVGFDDFYQNLVGFVGAEAADDVVAGVKARIIPASAGGPAQTTPVPELRASGGSFVTTPPSQQQGGGQLFCPTHQRPVKSIPKKDGSGTLHKCVVNDTFVSKFGEPGLKDRCPDSKG